MSTKISFFKVLSNRKIEKINDVNYAGTNNVDKFHFFFEDSEWDGLNKTLEVFVGDEMEGYPIVNDEAEVGRSVYKPGIIYIRVHGIDGATDKKSLKFPIPIAAEDCDAGDPANTPTESEWNAFITEINAKLAQAVITKEECAAILAQVLVYRDTVSDDKDDVEQMKTDIETLKSTIEQEIEEAEGVLDTYNANYLQKLAAFNENYAEKKAIIDEEVSDFTSDYNTKLANFNSNAESKTTDFNSNAASKKSDYDSNASAKKTDFNDNASSKKSDYNTNATNKTNSFNTNYDTKLAAINTAGSTQKTAVETAGTTQVGNVNTAGSTQVGAVETAGTTQVGNVNTAGTTQTNAVNAAGQAKLDEINSNQTVQQVADHEIRITRLEKASHIYGVKRARDNNSSSSWERTDDAVGLVANAQIGTTAVRNDFDNIKPWSNIIRKNIDLTTGNTTAYYGEAEFKLDGSNGDVYTEFPDIYWKVWQDEDYDYVQIADGPMEGFTKTKSFDIQSYLTGYVDNKLRSYSELTPARSANIGTYRNRARALGNNFCLLDWRYFVIQLLYLVEYADYNSQTKLGKGITSMRNSDSDKALIAETDANRIIISTNGNGNFIVGQTISIGNTAKETFQVAEGRVITEINEYDDGTITGVEIVFDGNPVNIVVDNVIWSSGQHSGGGDFLGMKSGCLEDDGKHSVNYRGIENVFGNIFPFVDGINIKDGQAYICYDPTEYASDKFTEPYEAIGYVNAYNGNDNYNGYAKTLGFDSNHPLVRFPTELGGSSSTYMTDSYYTSTGNRVARVGGYLSIGLSAGLWFWNLNYTSSRSTWFCGARVLKYQ